MSFLITESEYTESKNSAIKNLYKTAKKNNKSIVIHKSSSEMAIKSMNEQNDKILHLFIKSYIEFLKHIFNPNLIICYMDVAFQKNILLFCGDFEKVVYNLIKKNNDPYVECNICLEKKLLSYSCYICTFVGCIDCKKKLVDLCIENEIEFKCPICRTQLK